MSEIHIEEHSSPIKTPKQLVIVVVLAFAVPITLIVMLAQLVISGKGAAHAAPFLSGLDSPLTDHDSRIPKWRRLRSEMCRAATTS